MPRNTSTSYGSVARTLHWLAALLILGNIALGFTAQALPMEPLERKFLFFSLHKTLGIAAFLVALIRIGWALSQPRPAPVHPERRLENLAAETVHWLLYGAMLLVPLTGWIEHAATEGYAPILWPLGQNLPLIPQSPELAHVMAVLHVTLVKVLIGAVLLHVAGALKHVVIDRDGVLARMLRGRPAGPGHSQDTNGGHLLPAGVALAVFLSTGALAVGTASNGPPPRAALEQAASEWQVTQSELGFAVTQMGSEVQGGFADWTAAIDFAPETGTGSVEVVIDMTSVTIGTVTEQAKAGDFFDVANFPLARFQGEIRPDGDGFIAEGPLSLKGYQAPVTLPFSLQIQDGTATMTGQTVMDRRDWNVGEGYDNESSVGFSVTLSVALSAER